MNLYEKFEKCLFYILNNFFKFWFWPVFLVSSAWGKLIYFNKKNDKERINEQGFWICPCFYLGPSEFGTVAK